MRKQVFKWLVKAFAAGCIALVLLCIFCMFWYNVPVHYDNPSGATDYVWEAGKFYSRGIDGFALGRTNDEGLNNLRDYSPGDKIDILLMGSSHMEGFNVPQDKNSCVRINELFAGEKFCYNIGTAGHTLLNCTANLADALAYYKPGEYVIIESFGLDFEAEAVAAVVNGSFAGNPSHSGGIVGLLQKLPYLRLFYTQFFKNGGLASGDGAAAEAKPAPQSDFAEMISPLLDMVAAAAAEHGVQAIIVHDSPLLIAEDGSVYISTPADKLETFAALCAERGICFVDVCPGFIASYEAEHKLPYGFSNTSPGNGHMNSHGHMLFAGEVCRVIREMEG